jgi:hypothetical protein
MYQARLGRLHQPSEEYLLALRNQLSDWIRCVEAELAAVQRASHLEA